MGYRFITLGNLHIHSGEKWHLFCVLWGGIFNVCIIFQNLFWCIYNLFYIQRVLIVYELFFLLEMCLSEYDCWEIIVFWMGAFPQCSAACFILAVFLKALKPQALIWITRTFPLSVSPSFFSLLFFTLLIRRELFFPSLAPKRKKKHT